MIKITIGDLFESRATTLVNTVNCVGVMGKGIAQIFKKRFPKMFEDYVLQCRMGNVRPGEPYLYNEDSISIINFPTKRHWHSPSRLDDIIHGLNIFVEKYQEWNVKSIAFPPLGCGNGGLAWEVVGPIMYQYLSKLEIDIEIYAPYGTPHQQLEINFLKQSINNPNLIKKYKQQKLQAEWVALLEIVNRLQNQIHAQPVGRTIFQKICYIFTEQGVNTGLKFKQASYGPFSADVKETLSVLANNNLIYEQQLGKMTALKIGSEFQKAKEKFQEEICSFEKKIDKTVDLFSRIKSTEQAEEVTTILFASRQLKSEPNQSVSELDVYNYILNWKKSWDNSRKAPIVASGIRNLEMLGWLKLEYSESLPTLNETGL